MIALSFRWMVDLRWPPRFLQPLMRFFPGRRLRRFLSPMRDGSFVTPFGQAPHNSAMNSGKHIGLHGLFGAPDRARPKRIVGVAQKGNSHDTFGKLGLPRRA